MPRVKYTTTTEYIRTFPLETQEILTKIREIIMSEVPDAQEVISYNIPAYKYHGFLIYMSAYKKHYSLSFMPSSGVFTRFSKELEAYKKSKSTIQFPYTMNFPEKLIRDIVKLRATENLAAAK